MSRETNGPSAEREEEILEEERGRIATVIHDGVAQNLALLGLKLEIIARLADEDPARMKVELGNASEILKRSVMELRDVVSTLRSPNVDAIGFLAAARRVADGFSRQTHIDIELDLPETCTSSARVQSATFRAVLKRLDAIRRQGLASRVKLSLRESRGRITITVQDDGYCRPHHSLTVGIEPDDSWLTAMREQLKGCNAAVRVSYTPPNNVVEIVSPAPITTM